MYLPIDGDDLEYLFREWTSEAEEYTIKKTKFEEFRKQLKEAEVPFVEKENKLLEQKRKKDKKAIVTGEEKYRIWEPFNKIYRKIFDEVFNKK